jgi:hypothetical protein
MSDDDSMTDTDEAPDDSAYASQSDESYGQFGDWGLESADPLGGASDDLTMQYGGAYVDDWDEEEDEEREEEDEEREEEDQERDEDNQNDDQDDDEEEDEEREEEDEEREEEDEEREEEDDVEMYEDLADG